MTKEEFKTRWESSDDGGGIIFNDIAKCAVDWGLTKPIFDVLYAVLKAANTNDAEKYNPASFVDDEY